MLAICQTILLLLSSAYLTHSQVSPVSGGNNADFASGSFNLDTTKTYLNYSSDTYGTYYTMAFPSTFVTSKAPLIMNSVLKCEI